MNIPESDSLFYHFNLGLAEGEIPVITPVFKTPQSDGPFKDEIIIEVQKMNGQDFFGTITPTEARITIFEGVLGLAQEDLAGVTVGFNRGRTILGKEHELKVA